MRIIFCALLLFIGSKSFAKEKVNFCHSALAENTNLSFTEIFFVYLQKLHSADAVTISTLIDLKESIEKQTKLTNPVVKDSSDYEVHAGMVNNYLANSELDQRVLLLMLNEFLTQQAAVQKDKEQNRNETADPHKQIKFNKMTNGRYTQVFHDKDGRTAREQSIHVKHSFLMMDSFVSKYMWYKVFSIGELDIPSSKELTDDHSIIINRKVNAARFANKLSQLHGLKPAYKFQDLKTGYNETVKIALIDAPNGDVTKTEGYRLPTWQELSLVRTNYGEVKTDKVLPIINTQNLTQYAEVDGKAFEKPIAELLPVVIKGQLFYDLYNGMELTDNFVTEDDNTLSVPVSAIYTTPHPDSLICRVFNVSYAIGANVSFRLVRTLTK